MATCPAKKILDAVLAMPLVLRDGEDVDCDYFLGQQRVVDVIRELAASPEIPVLED